MTRVEEGEMGEAYLWPSPNDEPTSWIGVVPNCGDFGRLLELLERCVVALEKIAAQQTGVADAASQRR